MRSKRGRSFGKKTPDGEVLPCDVSVENLEKRYTLTYTISALLPIKTCK